MWEQIEANRRKTIILVVAMALILLGVGYVSGEIIAPGAGPIGLAIALAVWGILSLIAYFQGDDIFLGLAHAKKVDHDHHPQLYNVVEEMKIASGLEAMPDVYIIEDPSPNAFATGRKPEKAAVAVTTGLLQALDRNELQGVVAHEIGHIRNRDVLLMVMAGIMVGAIVMLADGMMRAIFWGGGRTRRTDSGGGGGHLIAIIIGIVLLALAPVLARILYFTISRKREYLADATAAVLTRYPQGLASALRRISEPAPTLRSASRATAPMYIVNPFAHEKRAAAGIGATHPPIQERIRILERMAGASLADYDDAYRGVTKRDSVMSTETIAVDLPGRSTDTERIAYPETRAARARLAGDALLDANGYAIFACGCGNKIKVPPELQFTPVKCPTCKTVHARK